MNIKKTTSILMSFGLFTSLAFSTAANVSAAPAPESGQYTLYMMPETNSVSAEELQEHDVTIHTKVYLKGSTNIPGGVASSSVIYNADSDNIYFDNISNINTRIEKQTINYSGGSFTTRYNPFCFGAIASDGMYDRNTQMYTPNTALWDTVYGTNILSDGNGGIYFEVDDLVINEVTYTRLYKYSKDDLQINNRMASFTYDYIERGTTSIPYSVGTIIIPNYNSETAKNTIILDESVYGFPVLSDGRGGINFEINCTIGGKPYKSLYEFSKNNLQINEDGSAEIKYNYIEADTNVEFESETLDIPYYDPELPAGEKLKGKNNSVVWNASTEGQSGAKFLGYSDEFAFFEFDIVLKKGTPCGAYNINFDTDSTEFRAKNSSLGYLPLNYIGTTILVGADSAKIINIDSPSDFCFSAEDKTIINMAQMGGNVSSEITFSDGTVEAIDITNAVTCNKSPYDLYNSQSGKAFIDNVKFYCGNVPLYNTDNSEFAMNIMVGKKGDANLDGEVSVDDASTILSYYAKNAAGLDASFVDINNKNIETLAYYLADIDTNAQHFGNNGAEITVDDASSVLSYYAKNAAGIPIPWDDFLK